MKQADLAIEVDPRMARAVDGMLGLYAASQEIVDEFKSKMVVREPDSPYGIDSNPEPSSSDLKKAIIAGARALNEWNGSWVLGGGLACNYYGPKRATADVDFFVRMDPRQLSPVMAAMARYDVMAHSQESPHALPPETGWWWVPMQFGLPYAPPVNVDVLAADHEFMAWMHATGRETSLAETRVRLIGVEALLIVKLQAFRAKDQMDAEAILRRNPDLDELAFSAWIARFQLQARLEEIRARIRNQPGRLG